MRANGGGDELGLAQHLGVGEAQDGPSQGFQIGLPQVIAGHDLVPIMDPAVDLDHQSQVVAGEIRDLSADRMLAAELVAVDPAAAQQGPNALLS